MHLLLLHYLGLYGAGGWERALRITFRNALNINPAAVNISIVHGLFIY